MLINWVVSYDSPFNTVVVPFATYSWKQVGARLAIKTANVLGDIPSSVYCFKDLRTLGLEIHMGA